MHLGSVVLRAWRRESLVAGAIEKDTRRARFQTTADRRPGQL